MNFTVANKPLVSVDSFVLGEHFDNHYFSPYDIGHKSLAATLSDIAACGGIPKYALIAMGLKNGNMEFVEEFCKGMSTIASTYGVEIIGGDTTKAETPFVSITVIGETTNFIKRSGAKTGDILCVTGELGSAHAGLKALQNGIESPIVEYHLHPTPRIKEGELLNRFVTSMIDISDGLILDLSHILEESHVGAKVFKEKIPIHEETREVAKQLAKDPIDYAFYGGEDFELLFTIDKKMASEAKKVIKLTEIGEIIEPVRRTGSLAGGSRIVDEKGSSIPVKGYDHFK